MPGAVPFAAPYNLGPGTSLCNSMFASRGASEFSRLRLSRYKPRYGPPRSDEPSADATAQAVRAASATTAVGAMPWGYGSSTCSRRRCAGERLLKASPAASRSGLRHPPHT
eukprot:6977229-Prymnesium_polylepis.1